MSRESEEVEGQGVYPTLELRATLAVGVGAVLTAAALLAVIGGAVFAGLYKGRDTGILISVSQGTPKLADRLNIFWEMGGGLPVAVVLLLAMVATALTIPSLRAGSEVKRVADATVVAIVAIAVAVVAVDALGLVYLVAGSMKVSTAVAVPPNRVGGAFGYLAPILVCTGVLYYGIRLFIDVPSLEDDDDYDDDEDG